MNNLKKLIVFMRPFLWMLILAMVFTLGEYLLHVEG